METSPSAVNWQPRNIARRPGELLRSAIQHVGPGRRRDPVLPVARLAGRSREVPRRAGAARRHGHPGLARGRSSCGGSSTRWARWSGSTVRNDVAMLFDWQAWWGCELDSHPSVDVTYLDRAHALHRSLTDAGVGVDLVHPESDLRGYRLVLVPDSLLRHRRRGRPAPGGRRGRRDGAGHLLQRHRRRARPHPARRLPRRLSATCSAYAPRSSCPLRSGERVRLDNGWSADVWTEDLHLAGADQPGDVRRRAGRGQAGADPERVRRGRRLVRRLPDRPGRRRTQLVRQLLAEAGVEPVAAGARSGVEITRRTRDGGDSWVFVVNHDDEPATDRRPRARPGARPHRPTAG